ncbi:MAG: DNA-3-methyladenine glycosylase I [Dehalococcoidales bacterium]|nr:DNA-3-methyladenine glycosylase I [Dehalococcoidales bacterium]
MRLENTSEEGIIDRCPWSENDDLYIKYHDKEWGVPVHDDRKHFEFLVLEINQAGLSWKTVLRKRDRYREVYDDFNPVKVAKYDDNKITQLLNDTGIIRNRRKIEASIHNAKRLLEIQKEIGSFDSYIWSFVNNKPLVNSWKRDLDIPARTELSDAVSKDLKIRGFKFIGSTIIYAHLQAVGIVNDHIIGCFRYKQLTNNQI